MKVKTLTTVLFVRMTPQEASRLKSLAKNEGFSSVSEWVRVQLKKVASGVDKR